MSKEGIRKVTQTWGKAVEEKRKGETEAVFDVRQPAEIKKMTPIETQASISTDGGYVHVRDEGWKEAKLVTVSAVRPKKETEKGAHPDGRRYKPYEPQMMLEKHSYQAGLWDADEMGRHQYLEGLRRDIPNGPKVSSPNDGAQWINRITGENFPNATQIIDWFHAAEKMWHIGKQRIGNKQARADWVGKWLDDLWMGCLSAVNSELGKVDATQALEPEDIEMSIGYFRRQQDRMKYHQYRIVGYPIGSGSVESGINNVIHHRMKRQGRGWCRENVNPMLAALSELHSGRFAQAWTATQ
jgi:rhodanese-related sulfurtransferase